MVHACWWYYFSKFTEFMDTVSIIFFMCKLYAFIGIGPRSFSASIKELIDLIQSCPQVINCLCYQISQIFAEFDQFY